MKRFKSFLAEQMENFINYRLQLGYSDSMMVYCLKLLDRHVVEKKVTWASFDPLFFINLPDQPNRCGTDRYARWCGRAPQ